MTTGEHETTINFDYENNMVSIYTTREGVRNGILKRLGDKAMKKVEFTDKYQQWQFEIPMNMCRSAQLVTKLINPDEKTPMPEGVFNAA